MGMQHNRSLTLYKNNCQAVSLILVVIWQVAGWDGVAPSPLGHILEGSTVGLLRVGSMFVGSLLSYRYFILIFEHGLTIEIPDT